ncbi:Gfo/Idh/MocA family protein [Hydrogenophaga sp. BPS33]|uniref:Gfo/Idh/MocA family protein n=1 Tax=Hydrogenophaga sp. BPS33 TaxID=2651974 RepID=UPI001320010C|nr:Gfo/Idh/MocA family oxidoreductase [Hydrogenophaga sp. BPS33]QHE88373.1 Gfo/Idh/MocA family oxidoreductase [Hydrogenophaga sp. BPS33]
MSTEPIRLGVLGLGRAFTLMLPTFLGDRRVALRAAFDPRASACAQFEDIFGGTAHRSPESLCADPTVEWIYVATPHQMHAEHVALAAAHGKSVLVEKPMALTLDDATRMIEACERAGVSLIVGHSHSFNAPVLQARQLIDTGALGEVRLVHAMQYTDFLYRPRRPEELDTARGGGVVFSQAAHQIDIVRLLAGGLVSQVRARTGAWDASRPTEGAFSALLDFQNGAFASVTYNGYGFYDTDVLMEGLGEMGLPKDTDAHRLTRARLASVIDEAAEAAMKAERNFGGSQFVLPSARVPDACQHFGPVIVSGDRGDLRLTPRGVELTDAQGTRFLAVDLPPVPRAEVIDELWRVAREDHPPVHGGAWSRATLEVCLAIIESGRQGVAIMPTHQVAYPMPSRPDA